MRAGGFFTVIGCVKCCGGQFLLEVYAMQFEAISTRYQPALASISVLPSPLATWLRALPTKDLMFYIGAPELAFGLLSLVAVVAGERLRRVEKAANAGMIIFMAGPLSAHLLADDWSLPMSSNVGPSGIVPAAVITALLFARLFALKGSGKEKEQ